jgi:hypothetical protein
MHISHFYSECYQPHPSDFLQFHHSIVTLGAQYTLGSSSSCNFIQPRAALHLRSRKSYKLPFLK